jgi:hypothetical protein
MFDDEELARTDAVGRAIHETVARLAVHTLAPTTSDILDAVAMVLHAYRPIEARAHRQKVAAHVHTYFRRLLPPAQWRFVGAEMQLGPGRVDLLWQDHGGALLIDELKTGNARQLQTRRTREQVVAYLDCAHSIWPDLLTGLRLLSTSEPARSLFISPDGGATQISTTPHVRSKSA